VIKSHVRGQLHAPRGRMPCLRMNEPPAAVRPQLMGLAVP
jgi:hypothetical protein